MTIRGLIASLDPAGGPQFPPDQPHPAGGADPVHGLVQQDREPAGARCLDRLLAAVFRSRSVGGQQDRVQEPARLLYARAPPGPAPGRSRSVRSWSVPPTASSARSGGSRTPNCSRSRARLIRCSICSAIPRWWSSHRNGRFLTLRLTSSMYHRFHAPYDCQDRAGDVHPWRRLERQSDRAEAGGAAVLQERARGAADPPRDQARR